MGFLDGLSGVDGMVAWMSSTTLWPVSANATSPSALRKLNVCPVAIDAFLL